MLIWILISVIIVSLIAFVGIFFFFLKEKFLNKILILLIALASGALLGGAFLHLIPESMDLGIEKVSLFVIIGILVFFILEKFLYWRHCHKPKCSIHTFSYTILMGDALHNFTDGLIIAAAYFINLSLGITTTIAIILHEIPQEIGDFGVLVYGGFTKRKALFYNFLSALTAILGAITGYFLANSINITYFLPFAAGGFIYIAATDLIPELHKKIKISESILQFIFIIIGLGLMWSLKFL